MKKSDITNGLSYIEVPEVGMRILCGCPENSIKFIMQKGLTPAVEINGFRLVSGPNAILLNDIPIFNSHFLNFSEFPVLHHQYFQGAAFNGTNDKVMLVGNRTQVNNQYNYIKRGLHGLVSKEEILGAGIEEELANKFLAIGNYHRGQDKKFDIINKIYINNKTRIKGDLFIERKSINIFEFTYKDQKIDVDLNFKPYSKGAGLPYNISNKLLKFENFSITTVGDGNGWNPEVPCMGALITAKGKRFLVDSGPGSLDLIRNLGVTPSEIEGVFITHSHDDHFAGILSLLNSDSKIKFFSSRIVIASVLKKFEALLNLSKDELKKYFEFIILKENIWTNIGEMEVKPMYSFHTIETNIFYFRNLNSDKEWKVYGHINDIISRKDLDYMLDSDQSGIIKSTWANKWFDNYLKPADLKRVDVGGGVVHGCSSDFVNDKSSKIILSHLSNDIDISASSSFSHPTEFGHTEVLIKSDKNYLIEISDRILSELNFFNSDNKNNINESDISLFKPNEVLLVKNQKIKSIYLVLSGLVETEDNKGYKRKYVKGDFLYSFNNEKNHKYNYITNSYCYLCKIDFKKLKRYLKRLKPDNTLTLLRNSTFFTYGFSFHKLLQLSLVVKPVRIKKDQIINLGDYTNFIVADGNIQLLINSIKVKQYKKDDLSTYNTVESDTYIALEDGLILLFKQKDIQEFTSLLWSCFEESLKIESIVETGII